MRPEHDQSRSSVRGRHGRPRPRAKAVPTWGASFTSPPSAARTRTSGKCDASGQAAYLRVPTVPGARPCSPESGRSCVGVPPAGRSRCGPCCQGQKRVPLWGEASHRPGGETAPRRPGGSPASPRPGPGSGCRARGSRGMPSPGRSPRGQRPPQPRGPASQLSGCCACACRVPRRLW